MLSCGVFVGVLMLLQHGVITPETLPLSSAFISYAENLQFSEKATYVYSSLHLVIFILFILFLFTQILVKIFNSIIRKKDNTAPGLNISTPLCGIAFLIGGALPLMAFGFLFAALQQQPLSSLMLSMVILVMALFYEGIIILSSKAYAGEELEKMENVSSKENLKANFATLIKNPSQMFGIDATKKSLPFFFTQETKAVIVIITLQTICIVGSITLFTMWYV